MSAFCKIRGKITVAGFFSGHGVIILLSFTKRQKSKPHKVTADIRHIKDDDSIIIVIINCTTSS